MNLHGYPCEFQWRLPMESFYIDSEYDILRELESVYPKSVLAQKIIKHKDKHVDRHNKCLCRGGWYFLLNFSAEFSTPTECKFHITLMGHERKGDCFESCGKFKISRKVTDYGLLCQVIKELYIFSNAGIPLYILLEILEDHFDLFKSYEIYRLLKTQR